MDRAAQNLCEARNQIPHRARGLTGKHPGAPEHILMRATERDKPGRNIGNVVVRMPRIRVDG